MGGVGAGCAVDLAQEFSVFNVLDLAVQTVGENGQFLAQGGGGGGLAVGARKHGHVAGLFGQLHNLFNQAAGGGQPDVSDGVLDTQGVGEVVDVFTGATEVNQGLEMTQAQRFEAAGDEVFHGLHIVHGDGFDFCQLGGRFFGEVGDDGAQACALLVGQGLKTGQYLVIAEVDEPFDLNVDAVAVESGF